jgi:hypothetical protein
MPVSLLASPHAWIGLRNGGAGAHDFRVEIKHNYFALLAVNSKPNNMEINDTQNRRFTTLNTIY